MAATVTILGLFVIGCLIGLLWLFIWWRLIPKIESKIDFLKESQSRFEQRLVLQSELAQELKGLLSTGQQTQQQLSTNVQQTLGALQQLRTQFDERRRVDDMNRQSLSRVEEIIAGTASKGRAGENILHEVLHQFPQEMVLRAVPIGGGEVEYALRLTNQKLLPIDSKWTATDLLQALDASQDDDQRQRLREEVDNTVMKHVIQVEKYIDPTLTVPWAVAAIPDAAYKVIRKAHIEAQRRHVFIISYGLIVPYLLSFFNLHLQYASSVDLEQLSSHLMEIQRTIEQMALVLENSIERAGKMIQNAAVDYRQLLGSLRGSVVAMTKPQQPVEEARSL